MTPTLLWFWASMLLAATLAGFGIRICTRAVFGDRSRGRRRCPKCWYEIATSAGRKCSECGREAPSEQSLLRTRRHWWRTVPGGLLVLAAGAPVGMQRVHQKGWLGAVPTAGYIAVLPWIGTGAGMRELGERVKSGTMKQWEYRWLARRCANSMSDQNSAERVHLALMVDWIGYGERCRFERPYESWASLSDEDKHRLVEALTRLLSDTQPSVRQAAALSLAEFGKAARPSIPALLCRLASADERWRQDLCFSVLSIETDHHATDRHGIFGSASKMFRANEFDRLVQSERPFFEDLARCEGDTSRVALVLESGLTNKNPAIREFSVWGLGLIAGERPDVQALVLSHSRDSAHNVRAAVVTFAARLPVEDRTRQVIGNGITDRCNVRDIALIAAKTFAQTGSGFLDEVRAALQRHQEDVSNAAVAYVKVGGDPFEAVAVILRNQSNLSQLFPGLRFDAGAHAIAGIGTASKEQVASLEAMMGSSDARVKGAAAFAYASVGGDAKKATRTIMGPGTKPMSRYRFDWLFNLSLDGRLDVGSMCGWLNSDDAAERAEGAFNLGIMGARAADSLPRLRELCNDASTAVAQAAGDAANRIEWELKNPEAADRLRKKRLQR